MSLVVKTAATGLAVSVVEAKAHLRVDTADDDTYIETLINVAADQYETDTGRTFYRRTYYQYEDAFPAGGDIVLQAPPLISATAVTYYSPSGATSTVSSSVYGVVTSCEPGRLVLESTKSWPNGTLRTYEGVRVEYTAGYGTATQAATEIPDSAKQGILLLVGEMYEERETAITGTIRTKTPAYQRLVWLNKVPTVA